MKITIILTFSQSRSYSEKNPWEDIGNITMEDDPESDMKKTDVKQVKKYSIVFRPSAEFLNQASLIQNLGATEPKLLCFSKHVVLHSVPYFI